MTELYPVPKRLLKDPKPFITTLDEYKRLWQESVDKPAEFFAKVTYYEKKHMSEIKKKIEICSCCSLKAAKEYLYWDRPFQTTMAGDLISGNIAWFLEGELNASYNCVDRHAFTNPNKVLPKN